MISGYPIIDRRARIIDGILHGAYGFFGGVVRAVHYAKVIGVCACV